jgi:uncharacterized membrane protein
MASSIVIVTFEDMTSANQVLAELKQLQKDKTIELADAVTVVKDETGEIKVSETTDFSRRRGAVTGGAIGLVIGIVVGGPLVALLLGAGAGSLLAKKIDLGVSKDKIQAVSDSMNNSSSAIFLQVKQVKDNGILGALMREHDGTVHEIELTDEHEEVLEAALTDTEARH